MVEKEIEFKNLLSEEEYQKIHNHYALESVAVINNSNYYYETVDFSLREVGAALRIRHTDSKSEITLKIRGTEGNLEYNVPYERNVNPEKIEISDLPYQIRDEMLKLGIDKVLHLGQKIQTQRKETILPEGLLVLDKTYFLGNIVDYELEFEVAEYKKGKIAFEALLEELEIERKEALPKIARAYKYKK